MNRIVPEHLQGVISGLSIVEKSPRQMRQGIGKLLRVLAIGYSVNSTDFTIRSECSFGR